LSRFIRHFKNIATPYKSLASVEHIVFQDGMDLLAKLPTSLMPMEALAAIWFPMRLLSACILW